MKQVNFSVIGGDARSPAVASQLHDLGYSVTCFGLRPSLLPSQIQTAATLPEAVSKSRYIILPLPVTQDEHTMFAPLCEYTIAMRDLPVSAKVGQHLFGGRLTSEWRTELTKRNILYTDYTERPEFAAANAVPTAEAAIEIVIRETPFTLNGASCLITGYGRIGKILAHFLHALGAKVTVAARRADALCAAEAFGCTPLLMQNLNTALSDFRIIFNTVPSLLFTEEALKKTRPDVLCIDLASTPGGAALFLDNFLFFSIKYIHNSFFVI